RDVLAAAHRIARIGGARVAVVAVARRAGLTHPGRAHLVAVAHGVVGAGRPVRDGRVLAARDRIAAVHGARVAVVTVGRRAGHARARGARLGAVAHGRVVAGRTVCDRRVLAAVDRITGVGRTRIPVVAHQRCARRAGARGAGLAAVAHGRVVAHR